MKGPMVTSGPYRVERIETPAGPRVRLIGPGLSGALVMDLACAERLEQLAAIANFAWGQRGAEANRKAVPA